MPVALPWPNCSLVSSLPSPSLSRNATMPPPAPPRPARVETNTSPFGATTRCRAAPTFSATTAAQNPCGSLMPPLSGSHAGAAARPDVVMRITSVANGRLARNRRFMGDILSPARKTVRLVDAARTGVHRAQRIRAERTGPLRRAIGDFSRDDALGRFAVLDPVVDRRGPVRLVGTGAAAAVKHAGHHEQAEVTNCASCAWFTTEPTKPPPPPIRNFRWGGGGDASPVERGPQRGSRVGGPECSQTFTTGC